MIVLVGNAPLERSLAAFVDRADHVIRFNGARGFGAESGRRIDELYLVNHGGQMAEWLACPDFARRATLTAAAALVLPVPMLPGHLSARAAALETERSGKPVHADRINHLDAARDRLTRSGHDVDRVSVAEYRAAQQALQTISGCAEEPYPSTGFIALHRTLDRTGAGESVTLCGFTFEGWRGHAWEAERRWVSAREAEGRLRLIRSRADCVIPDAASDVQCESRRVGTRVPVPDTDRRPLR